MTIGRSNWLHVLVASWHLLAALALVGAFSGTAFAQDGLAVCTGPCMTAVSNEGLILPSFEPGQIADPHSRLRHLFAPPEEGKWTGVILHGLQAVLVVQQAIDVGQSMYCIGKGRCHEANLVWRWAENKPEPMAAGKEAQAVIVTWASSKAHETHPKLAIAWLIGANVAQAWINSRNHEQLKLAGVIR